MLVAVLTAAGLLTLFIGVVAVHELGHYYAGRRIAGIPASAITIVFTSIPPYVALCDGDWIAPVEFKRYRAAYEQFDPEFEHYERYVAAGEIVQLASVVPLAVVLALAGFDVVAASLIVISLLTTVSYVVIDAGMTAYTDSPSGDYSALWHESPKVPIIILVGFVFTHLGAFYFIG